MFAILVHHVGMLLISTKHSRIVGFWDFLHVFQCCVQLKTPNIFGILQFYAQTNSNGGDLRPRRAAEALNMTWTWTSQRSGDVEV